MIIAAHFFSPGKEASQLRQCCEILARNNPEDHFIFFADPQKGINLPIAANCKIIAVTPSLRNGLLLHYWYNFKLPSLLNKYNASIFISEAGACSLRTTVPQYMLVKDEVWSSQIWSRGPHSPYIKKFFSKFVNKAAAVFLADDYLEQALLLKYPAVAEKFLVARMGFPSLYKQLSTQEKLAQQDNASQGHAYFLFDCSPATRAHAMVVLKAYSIFKRRLKSSLRLVIRLQETTIEQCVPDFKNYKYKDDVRFVVDPPIETYAPMLATAYAFICMRDDHADKVPGLLAMHCHIPIIALDTARARLLYRDAALYSYPDEKQLADQLMHLYKDEAQRMTYVEKGIVIASAYNWQNAANGLWQTILKLHGL